MSSYPTDFCRLCLRVDGIISIFSYDRLNSWQLNDKIFECVSVKITEDDILPQTICSRCLQRVNSWCDFKTACDRLQRTWWLWLKDIYGPPEVVKKKLKDRARKRCHELGFLKGKPTGKRSFPRESSKLVNFTNVKKPRNDCIVIEDDESENCKLNEVSPGPLITSTHSLSGNECLSIQADFQSSVLNSNENSESLPGPIDSSLSTNDCSRTNLRYSFEKDPREEASPLNSILIKRAVYSVDEEKNGSQLEISICDVTTIDSNIDVDQDELNDTVAASGTSNYCGEDGQIIEKTVTESSSKETDLVESWISDGLVGEKPINQSPHGVVLKAVKSLRECAQEVINTSQDRDCSIEQDVIFEPVTFENCLNSTSQDKRQSPLRKTAISKNSSEPNCYVPLVKGTSSSKELLGEASLRAINHGISETLSNTVPTSIESSGKHSDEPHSPDVRRHKIHSVDKEWCDVPSTPASLSNSLSTANSGQQAFNVTCLEEELLTKYTTGNPSIIRSSSIQAAPLLGHNETGMGHYSTEFNPVNIKQEPMSDDDTLEVQNQNFSYTFCEYQSIKTEPADCPVTPNSESEIVNYDYLNSNHKKISPTFCNICQQKFTNERGLSRHLDSVTHRRMSSIISSGQELSRSKRKDLYKEVISIKRVKFGDSEIDNVGYVDHSLSPHATSGISLLKCPICKVVFKSRAQKVKHVCSAVQQDKLQGSKGVQLANKNQLRSSGVATPDPVYKCPFADCLLSFNEGGQLIVHMHSHGISMFPQEIENSSMKTFNEPEVSSVPTPGFQQKLTCPFCQKSCLNRSALTNHKKFCRAKNQNSSNDILVNGFKCSICHIFCKSKRSLSYHVTARHSERPTVLLGKGGTFKCSVCSKPFRSRLLLNIHMKSHKTSGVLTCQVCKKGFIKSSNLLVHLRKHFNVGKGHYICYQCLEMFDDKELYLEHKLTVCTLKMKIFPCKECNHSYSTQALLDKHKRKQHCKKETNDRKSVPLLKVSKDGKTKEIENQAVKIEIDSQPPPVKVGTSMKSMFCVICKKSFQNKYNYRRHLKSHSSHKKKHARTFLCSTCNVKFDSKILYEVHTCPSFFAADITAPTEDTIQDTPIGSIPNTPNSSNVPDDVGKSYKCQYCETHFIMYKYLRMHLKGCKSLVFKCGNCGYSRKKSDIKNPCRGCNTIVDAQKNEDLSVGGPLAGNSGSRNNNVTNDSEKIVYPKEKYLTSMLHYCPLGKKSFLSHKNLDAHILTCTGTCKDSVVYCKICRQKFETPKIYLKHKPCKGKKKLVETNVSNDKSLFNLSCLFCSKQFMTQRSVSCHMKVMHNFSKKESQNTNSTISTVDVNEEASSFADKSNKASAESNSPSLSPEFIVDPKEFCSPDDTICPSCLCSLSSPASLHKHITIVHRNSFVLIQCAFCDKKIFKRELYEHGFECITSQLASVSTLECVVCKIVIEKDDQPDMISIKLQEHILNCCGRLTIHKGDKYRGREKKLCFKCCKVFTSKSALELHLEKRHKIFIDKSSRKSKEPEENDKEIKLESLLPEEANPPQDDFGNDVSSAEGETSKNDGTTLVKSESASPIFKCNLCSRVLKTAENLRIHEISAHPVTKSPDQQQMAPPLSPTVSFPPIAELKCKFCQRVFNSMSKLINHEKVHGIVQQSVFLEANQLDNVPIKTNCQNDEKPEKYSH